MTPAELSRTVLTTVRRAVAAEELRVAVPEKIVVQRPPRPGRGDYATNVALQLAGAAGATPYQVAEILSRRLKEEPGIAQVEIAGPGFLNITLNATAYGDVVRQVRAQGAEYGRGDGLAGETVGVAADPDDVRGTVVAEVVARLARAAGASIAGEPAGERAGEREAGDPLVLAPGPPAGEPLVVAPASPAGDPPASTPAPEPLLLAPDPLVVAPAPALQTPLGPDELRWALLRPPAEDVPRLTAHLLVQRESNPLFRIRYAHARTRALLRNAHDLGVRPDAETETPHTPAYHHPAETELLGLIADFPRVIETAARRRAPDRLARHLERLADAFFRFHDECPPLPKGDEKPSAVHAARIRLADATGIVLAAGLHLLGITAPERL